MFFENVCDIIIKIFISFSEFNLFSFLKEGFLTFEFFSVKLDDIMEDKYIKITNAVYKLLDFFPESDPLKNRAKDKALQIMESMVLLAGWQNNAQGWTSVQKEKIVSGLLEDIEILKTYLKLGNAQGWIDNINFLIVCQEYDNIKTKIVKALCLTAENHIIDIPPKTGENEKQTKIKEIKLSERQKKIIKILEEKGKAQVSDFKTVLTDVTKRTIRRDLDELLEAGKITRIGEWNQVFYKITSETSENLAGTYQMS